MIYDELHAAPTRDLWDVLASSTGARAQPLVIAISTAGYDRHSILWELYAHGKKVLEDAGARSDVPRRSSTRRRPTPTGATRRVWRQANPALGDFRSLEEMRVACARAQEIPAQENAFRRLYLNQWTEQAARWIALDGLGRLPGADRSGALAGRRCYVGLDLSTTTDLTAAVAVFPDDDGPGLHRRCRNSSVPPSASRRASTRDRVPYDEWARRGFLIVATPGPTVDYERVRAELLEWQDRYQVRMVAFDPWNATDLVSRLEKVDGFTCVKMRQGKASLSAPSKALEKAILEKTLRHDGHPVLRWNIANASVDTDNAGNIQPSQSEIDRTDRRRVRAGDGARRDAPRPGAAAETEIEMYIFGGPP